MEQQIQSTLVQPQEPAQLEQAPVLPQKKFNLKIIVILLVAVLLVAGGVYAGMQMGDKRAENGLREAVPESQTCTRDAMICPDGTEVGRVGPDCEFAPCPESTVNPTAVPAIDETANWWMYVNEEFGFQFKYPQTWSIRKDSSFLEEMIFSITIIGETQRQATSLYDGAVFAVIMPIYSDKEIELWVKEFYPARNVNDDPNEFSQVEIGGWKFEKVRACGLGCFDYLNIKKDNHVYRFMVFADGELKNDYLRTIEQIFSTFKFKE